MTHPGDECARVRKNRTTINNVLYSAIDRLFTSSSQSNNSGTYADIQGVTATRKEPSGKTPTPSGQISSARHWYEFSPKQSVQHDFSTISVIRNSDIENSQSVEKTILTETIEPQTVTHTVDKTDIDYGVGHSGIWCTKQLLRCSDIVMDIISEAGVPSNKIEQVEQAILDTAQLVHNYNPNKNQLSEMVMLQDIDAIESLTEVSFPETTQELRDLRFGDNSPPIARNFLLNSGDVNIEFSDEEVTLFRGGKDGYDLAMLIGVDDGGAFYHPMPRTLRVDNPSYNVERQDIRNLMAYDNDWSKGETISKSEWNRIQGDLLLKHVPKEDVIEKYQQVAICDLVDEDIQQQFLSQSQIAPIDGQVKFDIVQPRNLPKIAISYPSGPGRRTIETDLRLLMNLDDEQDPGYILVSNFIDWIIENYDVGREAQKMFEDSMEESSPRSFGTQIDNHLLMVDEAHFEPEPEFVYQDFMLENDERNFSHFFVDEPTNMNIQHREHDPISVTLPEGAYILTLARRRNQ